MVESHIPDFGGKLLAVYLRSAASQFDGGILVEYPELQLLGGRYFLVGRSPTLEGDDWCANLPVSVAWDSVSNYLVFDSREAYLARMKAFKQPLWRRLVAAFRAT